VVDGVCDRFGPSPQPCGEGRYCVRIGRAVTCARAGTAGATCRLDGAAPCGDGLVCETDRCVPWLGEAAPCSRVPGGAGVCGAGLVCAPLGCVGPPSACAWQDAETDGRCRRHAPAGALDGDCTRGPDGRATCAAGLACDATFLYCRALAAPGDPCDAGRVCADGTRCLYGVDPLRCVSAGGRTQPCRLDLARQCDPGLVCAAGRCSDAAAAGEDCARSRPCANGTECFARPDGTFACERVGVEGARCTGTSDPGCAPGLYCGGSTCARALAAGEACSALGLPCADQLVCATESTSPRTCRPRGSAGSPCREVSECDDGLACNGACVPIRARSAACDPSGRSDACEGGYACVDGRCAAPTEGLPCAAGRCRDGLRCFGDTCRRPREPGEACAGSGGGAPCREDSACADGVCRVLGAAGAPCRRVRDAPACDGAMRCDLLADRCVP
jgi:hypothetical protein